MTASQAIKILHGDFTEVELNGRSHTEIFAEAFGMAVCALEEKIDHSLDDVLGMDVQAELDKLTIKREHEEEVIRETMSAMDCPSL